MSQTPAAKQQAEDKPQTNADVQAAAMELGMKLEPTREHKWLQKFVGEWTYEMDASMEPGKPPVKMTGSETIRPFGEVWVQGHGTSQMPDGSPAETQITLGYDPLKKRFIGTWLGTMMAHLWVYDGELSADERTLTLNSEGPSMTEQNKRANYRDVFEFKNDDLRTLTAFVQGDDGQWSQFMTLDYHRKK
jgi:hypothetical protein